MASVQEKFTDVVLATIRSRQDDQEKYPKAVSRNAQAAVSLRPAEFSDFEEVARLGQRLGQGSDSEENWEAVVASQSRGAEWARGFTNRMGSGIGRDGGWVFRDDSSALRVSGNYLGCGGKLPFRGRSRISLILAPSSVVFSAPEGRGFILEHDCDACSGKNDGGIEGGSGSAGRLRHGAVLGVGLPAVRENGFQKIRRSQNRRSTRKVGGGGCALGRNAATGQDSANAEC